MWDTFDSRDKLYYIYQQAPFKYIIKSKILSLIDLIDSSIEGDALIYTGS